MPPLSINRLWRFFKPTRNHFSTLSFDISSVDSGTTVSSPGHNFLESRLSTGFELEFLGTSSAASTMTRNVSSLALNYGCIFLKITIELILLNF
jgi:hypothetical protein